VCQRYFEDGAHLFFKCRQVKSMWRALEMEDLRTQLAQCDSPLRVIQRLLALPADRQITTVALLWCWWAERNKENHKERRLTVDEFQFQVRRHTAEWVSQNRCLNHPNPTAAQRWNPPPEDYMMINCDGAFSAERAEGGWGAVARDHVGDLVFAAAGHLTHTSQAMHAEAVAVKNALSIADQMGIGRIIIASDCQNVVKAITSNAFDGSSLGQLFLEIKYQLSMSFIQYRVIFCPRACNKVAHLLAAKGARERHDFHAVWDVSYPDDVRGMVASDLAEP
jgi:hypothetical protein